METLPKYARWEHERRFLVPRSAPQPWNGSAARAIRDRYLDAGRLRLREVTDDASGEKTYKLCKKFRSDSRHSEPIVNIYLSEEEYRFCLALPGRDLEKRRFHDTSGGRVFSIDVFEGALEGLILCEIEADSVDELMAIEFPGYARLEVTEDAFFTGGSLVDTSARVLERRLRELGA